MENQPIHKIQRIISYVSGMGIKVYETEQYNQYVKEWYIVGDCSTNEDLIIARINHYNFILTHNTI